MIHESRHSLEFLWSLKYLAAPLMHVYGQYCLDRNVLASIRFAPTKSHRIVRIQIKPYSPLHVHAIFIA
jgi:hypothetical protein